VHLSIPSSILGHLGVQPEEHQEGGGDDHHLSPHHLPDLTPEKDEAAEHVVLHLHVPEVIIPALIMSVFLFTRHYVWLACIHILNSSSIIKADFQASS
jgi:hypothetical protein